MMDEKNLRIMEGIAKGLSLDEIAEYAGVSKKTAYNRIKALEDRGIVKKVKRTWEIDYKKAECDTIGILLLGVHNDYEGLKKMITRLEKFDFVEKVYKLVGSNYNLLVVVRYKNLKELVSEGEKFLEWLQRSDIKIDSMAQFVGETVKDSQRTILV
ncbi:MULTISPECIES: helix-turn-helix domain-containing protein [unclassified Archaeoglobus]|jgi:DNA-binding Lrp family transcriptional regulator|uniref:helix-turn-helix domain-containing protein n=1 Tax=unclassified Archaeoglobus TaxID=2643606 RepID=UPI0025BF91D4|nr:MULTISPECIES: helix-turn-helix domain-containing protein [unclassified Archaeoglobus]